MKPRTREARLAITDSQGRPWHVRWLPGDQLFVGRLLRARTEYVLPAVALVKLFEAQVKEPELPLEGGEAP